MLDRHEFLPDAPRSRRDRLRDAVAVAVANWMLNHVASEWYRTRIHALILIGIGVTTRPKQEESAE